MIFLGAYFGRKVYYINTKEDYLNNLPNSNWICFAIANEKPNEEEFKTFIRNSIEKDILEFKGFGIFGSFLDIQFDLEMVKMEVEENHEYIDVMTTGFQGTDFSSAFYENFIATCLPERTDYDNLNIVCVSFDNYDYTKLVRKNIKRLNKSWLPLEPEKKIIMDDKEINIKLNKDEALVLFDFLSRLSDKDQSNLFEDHAEEKILWNIESVLQSILVEPFQKEYKDILEKSRKIVRES